jgi:hypothetical protein
VDGYPWRIDLDQETTHVRTSSAASAVALSLLLATTLLPATARAARPLALVRVDVSCALDPDCERARLHLAEALVAEGLSVVVSVGGLDSTALDRCECAWDIGTTQPLVADDAEAYGHHLRRGKGLYLGGENIYFDVRNQSIAEALRAFGGGAVLVWPSRPVPLASPDLFPESVNLRTLPRHPVVDFTLRCGVVDEVVYDGVGVGWFQLASHGDVLTGIPTASPAAAWGMDRGGIEDLLAAPEGRVVSVLDLNWLANTFDLGDNRRYAAGMVLWLCGGADGGASRTPHCAPRTQGFWQRQCHAEADDGGPELLVDDWRTVRPVVDAILRSVPLPGIGSSRNVPTCEGLDAEPESDPCERALKQVTAWLLNVQDGLVSCDCPFDEETVASLLAHHGLLLPGGLDTADLGGFLVGLVAQGRCDVAAEIAAALNEGRLLPDYEGEGDTSSGFDSRGAESGRGAPGRVRARRENGEPRRP